MITLPCDTGGELGGYENARLGGGGVGYMGQCGRNVNVWIRRRVWWDDGGRYLYTIEIWIGGPEYGWDGELSRCGEGDIRGWGGLCWEWAEISARDL